MSSGIGRASAFLASGTMVSRILGFVKTVVLVSAIGLTGAGADAFGLANQLPNTVYVIVAGGVLSAVLVPQIVRAGLHSDGGQAYINKLLTLALVILGITTLAATALAPVLTWMYGGTFPAATLALATAFAYWCLPQIFFYGLYTLLGEVLNARKYFGPFTWVPVLNNLVSIAGLIAMIAIYGSAKDITRTAADWTPEMIALIGGTATAGVALQALILFWFWRRIGLRYRPDFVWRGVGLGAAGKMASWTFGMLLLSTGAGLVETNVAGLAAASGTDASVAVLSTAWLLFMLPHSVIAVSIATAYFTRMSEHASQNRFSDVRADISSAIRGIGLIIVLAAAVLIVCAYPFAAVYIPGDFDEITSFGNVVIAYLAGLVAFSILFVVQRAFYALGDTRTPFFFTLFQVVLFSIGALFSATLPAEWIAVGIASTTTFAGLAQLILATLLLRKRLGGIDGARILRSLGGYAFAVALPVLVGLGWLTLLGGTQDGGFALSGRPEAIISMIVIGLIMSGVYFAILLLLRSRELLGFLEPALARIRRR